PEVRREMEDWYFAMEGTPELTRFFQEQLRFRKFYDGPADGKPNPAYAEALAAHRLAQGLPTEGEPGLDVLRAFLLQPIPTPPAKRFVLDKPAAAIEGAAPAVAPQANDVKVAVKLAKSTFRKGEPIELTVTTARPGYVYCYVQSQAT